MITSETAPIATRYGLIGQGFIAFVLKIRSITEESNLSFLDLVCSTSDSFVPTLLAGLEWPRANRIAPSSNTRTSEN